MIQKEYQWVFALILPLYREFNVWILTKMAYRVAGDITDRSIGIIQLHDMATRHAMVVSVLITSSATLLTSSLLLGIDFAINVALAVNIIRKKMKNPSYDPRDDVYELLIGEKIEVVVPLLYSIMFAMAYYGPNAELLGGMKISLWTFGSTANPDDVFYYLVLFFSIDFLSAVINSILLWIFCRINCFEYYLNISKMYWVVMAVQEAHWLNEVNWIYLIVCI